MIIPEYVRSRINADNELWNGLPELKEEYRMCGIIPRLESNFNNNETRSAYLCSPYTDHIPTDFSDLGWGCGYRNCQMLMTFLERQKEDGDYLLRQVLDISGLQLLLERAWKEGFDSLGAQQLKHHVFKTRKWIGTSEVYTLLTYLGIRSTIIDFHQPGPHRLHEELMNWIEYYFTTNIDNKQGKNTFITNRPPLYLQHQGHSRTVVGIEILKSGKRNLILFDPSRRMLRSYKSRPNYNEEEDEEDELDIEGFRVLSPLKNKSLPANALRSFRVDDKTIAKHKQYQVLVLGEVVYQQEGKLCWNSSKGYLLNEEEREVMKNITTLTVI
ncbi:peptidase family C78-domain-containing protein [Pilobolus umbonatus]|nr:peptidase family C78-domain-containing protein [Pilobolus umbonatus]